MKDIEDWLEAWASLIRESDFDAARDLFDHGIVGFGTVAERAEGLEMLEGEQWRAVWPVTTDFDFDLETLHCLPSQDGNSVVACLTWSSLGYDPEGDAFQRRGRATILLGRASKGDRWKARHTHFSFAPAPAPPGEES